jgi:hypothetical protein
MLHIFKLGNNRISTVIGSTIISPNSGKEQDIEGGIYGSPGAELRGILSIKFFLVLLGLECAFLFIYSKINLSPVIVKTV